jgi:hypothetical protein
MFLVVKPANWFLMLFGCNFRCCKSTAKVLFFHKMTKKDTQKGLKLWVIYKK